MGGISPGTTVEQVRDYFRLTFVGYQHSQSVVTREILCERLLVQGVGVAEVEFKHDKATQRMRGRTLHLSLFFLTCVNH